MTTRNVFFCDIFHMGVGVGSEFIASEFILSFGMIVGQYVVCWLALLPHNKKVPDLNLLSGQGLSVHLPEQEP